MSTRRRIFPEAFKRVAVDRVASSALSVEKVATELSLLLAAVFVESDTVQ